jgi:hypothetical protein
MSLCQNYLVRLKVGDILVANRLLRQQWMERFGLREELETMLAVGRSEMDVVVNSLAGVLRERMGYTSPSPPATDNLVVDDSTFLLN